MIARMHQFVKPYILYIQFDVCFLVQIQTIVQCLYPCMCMWIVYMMLHGLDYQCKQYLLLQHLLCCETISFYMCQSSLWDSTHTNSKGVSYTFPMHVTIKLHIIHQGPRIMIVYKISKVIQNKLICISRFHGIDILTIFQWSSQKWKLLISVSYMMIFWCYFGIIQLFLGHSINMAHSCIAMLHCQTILSKISGK